MVVRQRRHVLTLRHQWRWKENASSSTQYWVMGSLLAAIALKLSIDTEGECNES